VGNVVSNWQDDNDMAVRGRSGGVNGEPEHSMNLPQPKPILTDLGG
jgi:hypothetical protein